MRTGRTYRQEAFSGPNRTLSLRGEEIDNRAEVYQPLMKLPMMPLWRIGETRGDSIHSRLWCQEYRLGKGTRASQGISRCPGKGHANRCDDRRRLRELFLRKPDVQFYQVTADGINVCRWW